MHEIILCSECMPTLCGCDLLAASEAFRHADRVADFNVMIYVAEGEIPVTEDGTDFTVSAGELLFLKRGVHHWGERDVPKGTRWFYAHFTMEERELPPFSPDTVITPYSRIAGSAVLPKYITGLSDSDTEREIFSFAEYYAGSDPLKSWYLNQRFFMLLSGIALTDYTEKRQETLGDKICNYLSSHKNQPFSAKELSREFFLSYNRLAAVFRAEKGCTLQQYHQARRMEEAQAMLRSTLLPIGEIAARLGYQDMLYFSRCFREYSGCSPTDYRRRTAKI